MMISGNIKVTPALKSKLNQICTHTNALYFHATLMKNNRDQLAQISITTPAGMFTAKKNMKSLYYSINRVNHKLQRQLAKEKTKEKRRRRIGRFDKEAHLVEWTICDEDELA